MGWKSTMTIKKHEAIQLIMSRLLLATDEELADALESLGYGEDYNLPYFGHNFIVEEEL